MGVGAGRRALLSLDPAGNTQRRGGEGEGRGEGRSGRVPAGRQGLGERSPRGEPHTGLLWDWGRGCPGWGWP